MARSKKRLRAIDLYSGVGGWSLGLQLAGIDVVASYDRWDVANKTNSKNNGHRTYTVDIRSLDLGCLPKKIDIVVGSPPCTQFSYSNRGGSGDIADGMRDIVQFLTIVDFLKPKIWAMENVPRVAKVIEEGLRPGGPLEKFKHLGINPHVINMEDFGLPQRRLRCIAGNFNFECLNSYALMSRKKTLGDVISALKQTRIVDPNFGFTLSRADLHDHQLEEILNEEEVRINRAAKMFHPVYNSMPFPDSLNRSVRTITATCTRVSRESIVIENPEHPGTYRRLSIRERATLQGFPLHFQFYGHSYSQKLRMVGNAVPPAFTYLLANAFQDVPSKSVVPPSRTDAFTRACVVPPITTVPDKPGTRYPVTRTFRFAIPSLRLKSGVRFDMVNNLEGSVPNWGVSFYFGTSKAIHTLALDKQLRHRLCKKLPKKKYPILHEELCALSAFIQNADVCSMQRLWSHSGPGRTRPFMLFDRLDETGEKLLSLLREHTQLAQKLIIETITENYGVAISELPGVQKLLRNAPLILSGLLVGAVTNEELATHLCHVSVYDRQRAYA